MDTNASSVLVLLDFSAAFDTMDHSIFYIVLNTTLESKVLLYPHWFQTYLTDRKQFLLCEGSTSKHCNLSFGIPQGLVLGPLLFAIYMLPLGNVIPS